MGTFNGTFHIDGEGTDDHGELENVTPDQHHDKSHTHDGVDGSGSVDHDDLSGISANDHHPEDHDHDGSSTQKLAQANTHDSPDTDSAPTALHHTLGTGANQSAAGDHGHANIPTPADAVVTETAFGQASAVGVNATEFAREDHTHGTPASPSVPVAGGTVVSETAFGQSAAAGVDADYSREDHTHGTPAAPVVDYGEVGDITSIEPDDATGAGVLDETARADHQHGIVAATAGTIEPDDAAVEGVATSFSRSDHKHSNVAAVAGASAPGDTAAEGVATSFARSDHRHSREAGGVTYLDRDFTGGCVSNTTVLTTIYSKLLIPSQFAGQGLELQVAGEYLNNTAATKTIRLVLDFFDGTNTSVLLDATSDVIAQNASQREWTSRFVFWFPGSSASEVPEGLAYGGFSVPATPLFRPDAAQNLSLVAALLLAGTMDATINQTLRLRVQHSVANANINICTEVVVLKAA